MITLTFYLLLHVVGTVAGIWGYEKRNIELKIYVDWLWENIIICSPFSHLYLIYCQSFRCVNGFQELFNHTLGLFNQSYDTKMRGQNCHDMTVSMELIVSVKWKEKKVGNVGFQKKHIENYSSYQICKIKWTRFASHWNLVKTRCFLAKIMKNKTSSNMQRKKNK